MKKTMIVGYYSEVMVDIDVSEGETDEGITAKAIEQFHKKRDELKPLITDIELVEEDLGA